MEIIFIIGLVLLGMVMGSFAGAQIWRLRARQLHDDYQRENSLAKKKKLTKYEKEELSELKIDNKEFATERKKLGSLLKQKVRNDRSRCLSCGHELKWYDLLPVISWLSLGGKCRYCKSPIGWMEITLEIVMAGLFAGTFVWWSSFDVNGIISLVIWLISLVLLAILFVYDFRWSLLPDKINWSFIALGLVFAILKLTQAASLTSAVWSLLGSVFVLSGIYLFLHLISRGKWVGFGDVKLGLGLGLFLGDWLLALLALFLANLIGTLLVLPGMLRGTLKGDARIPFGPLLIIGFLISWFVGEKIISWYILSI